MLPLNTENYGQIKALCQKKKYDTALFIPSCYPRRFPVLAAVGGNVCFQYVAGINRFAAVIAVGGSDSGEYGPEKVTASFTFVLEFVHSHSPVMAMGELLVPAPDVQPSVAIHIEVAEIGISETTAVNDVPDSDLWQWEPFALLSATMSKKTHKVPSVISDLDISSLKTMIRNFHHNLFFNVNTIYLSIR